MLNSSDIETVKTLALEAGRMLKIFARDPVYTQSTEKSDGSMVTKADLEVSQFLVSKLSLLGFPVVSEEGDLQLDCQEDYFLVDPLDGTKYFVEGAPDYGVLIGYIGQGTPDMGVICGPEKDRILWAVRGQGCFLGDEPINRRPLGAGPRTSYSSGYHKKALGRWLASQLDIQRFLNRGSMLKFCDLVEGAVDLYPRFGPTGEWDTAAAQIILEEAGYCLVDLRSGKPMTYGKPKRLNPGFLACHKDLREPTLESLQTFLKAGKNGESHGS